MEVQSGSRLVEDEKDVAAGRILAQKGSELYPLRICDAQSVVRLSLLYVVMSHMQQGSYYLVYRLLFMEDAQSLFYGEIEDGVEILSIVFGFKDFCFKAFSMAGFRLTEDVG